MFCRYCGKEINGGANFCDACGKKIEMKVHTKCSRQPSKKNNNLFLGVILGAVLCAVIIGVGMFLLKDKTSEVHKLPTEDQTLLDNTDQTDTSIKINELQIEDVENVMIQFLYSLQVGDIEKTIELCSSTEYQYYGLMYGDVFNNETVSIAISEERYDISEDIIKTAGIFWSELTPYCELYKIDNNELQKIKEELPYIERDCDNAFWAVAGYQTNDGEKVYRMPLDILLVNEKEEWVLAGILGDLSYEKSDPVMESVHSMMIIIENAWEIGGTVDCASYIVQKEFGTYAAYFSKKALIWDSTKNKVTSMTRMSNVLDVVMSVNYNFDLACTDFISLNWKNVQDIVEHNGGICLDGSTLSQTEIKVVDEMVNNVSDSEKVNCNLVWNKIKNSELITADEINALNAFYRPMLRSTMEYRFSKMLTQALIDIFKNDKTILISDEVFNNCRTSYSKEELIRYKWEALDRQMFVYSDGKYENISQFGNSLQVDDYTSLPKKIHYMLFDDREYVPSENVKEIHNKLSEFNKL